MGSTQLGNGEERASKTNRRGGRDSSPPSCWTSEGVWGKVIATGTLEAIRKGEEEKGRRGPSLASGVGTELGKKRPHLRSSPSWSKRKHSSQGDVRGEEVEG